MKVLLRGVLIDRLPALDAVELGGCSFFTSLGESYWRHAVRIPIVAALVRGESSWLRAAPVFRSAADVVVVLYESRSLLSSAFIRACESGSAPPFR